MVKMEDVKREIQRVPVKTYIIKDLIKTANTENFNKT